MESGSAAPCSEARLAWRAEPATANEPRTRHECPTQAVDSSGHHTGDAVLRCSTVQSCTQEYAHTHTHTHTVTAMPAYPKRRRFWSGLTRDEHCPRIPGWSMHKVLSPDSFSSRRRIRYLYAAALGTQVGTNPRASFSLVGLGAGRTFAPLEPRGLLA